MILTTHSERNILRFVHLGPFGNRRNAVAGIHQGLFASALSFQIILAVFNLVLVCVTLDPELAT